jgi:hypothetical protein
MDAPICPNCGQSLHRVIDVPYGWWEWDSAAGEYRLCTATDAVEVSPWVHTTCMQQLRGFHPQNRVAQPIVEGVAH